MPIAALNEQNDARGSAWLLARMARDSIVEPASTVNAPAMNSLYRLLEAYKEHRFFGFDHQPNGPATAESFTLNPPAERGFAQLKAAFAAALEEAFGRGSSPDQAISSIEEVLVSVTYPERGMVEPDKRALAVKFLDSFIDSLEPQRI